MAAVQAELSGMHELLAKGGCCFISVGRPINQAGERGWNWME